MGKAFRGTFGVLLALLVMVLLFAAGCTALLVVGTVAGACSVCVTSTGRLAGGTGSGSGSRRAGKCAGNAATSRPKTARESSRNGCGCSPV